MQGWFKFVDNFRIFFSSEVHFENIRMHGKVIYSHEVNSGQSVFLSLSTNKFILFTFPLLTYLAVDKTSFKKPWLKSFTTVKQYIVLASPFFLGTEKTKVFFWLKVTPPRYTGTCNWNIVESGIKHHKPINFEFAQLCNCIHFTGNNYSLKLTVFS